MAALARVIGVVAVGNLHRGTYAGALYDIEKSLYNRKTRGNLSMFNKYKKKKKKGDFRGFVKIPLRPDPLIDNMKL